MTSLWSICEAAYGSKVGSHLSPFCGLHVLAEVGLERNPRLWGRSVDKEYMQSPPPGDDGPKTRQNPCGGAAEEDFGVG